MYKRSKVGGTDLAQNDRLPYRTATIFISMYLYLYSLGNLHFCVGNLDFDTGFKNETEKFEMCLKIGPDTVSLYVCFTFTV